MLLSNVKISLEQVSLQASLQQYLFSIIEKSELGKRLALRDYKLTRLAIPLYRLKDPQQLIYRCSLAFAVGKKLEELPQKIAEEIWEGVSQEEFNISTNQDISEFPLVGGTGEVKANFKLAYLTLQVQVVNPGWLEFRFDNQALSRWLQFSFNHPPEFGEQVIFSQRYIFECQYAHARCCSLLQLARRESFIQFSDDFLILGVGWQLPLTLFDCDLNRRFEGVCWSLEELWEQKLSVVLIDLVDCVEGISEQEAEKLGKRLSTAVLAFYDHSRIWGEVRRHQPQLAVRRLALIAIAQIWLRWLLQEKLQTIAPLEL